MSGTRRQVCLNLTELEISTIQALFSHSEWDFDSCVVFNNWSESNTDEVIRSCTNQEITAVCSTSANFPGQDEEQLAVGATLDMEMRMKHNRSMNGNACIVFAIHV